MKEIRVHDKVFVPYISDEEIQEIIRDLALRIYEDYKDEIPVFVGVLNGVFMFFSDLLKAYPGECEVGFLQMNSYSGTQSTGVVETRLKLTRNVADRHVIIVEDIVDTGNTLEALVEYFKTTESPKSLKVTSFLLKPEVYKKKIPIDYIGKSIPNRFVLGYGMDYDELGRNLKDLYWLK